MNDPGDVLVCRCEEVTRKDIEKAIDEGCTTINEIKRRTRAGMGLCQGRTCTRLIAQILGEKTGKNPEEITPPTKRIPSRPVSISVFDKSKEDCSK